VTVLDKLFGKKRLTVIGLNSGTSADGVDAAAVRISRDRGQPKIRYLDGLTRKYPADLRAKVVAAADWEKIDPSELVLLDAALGRFFGKTARALQKRLQASDTSVDFVASHGQTVRHLPEPTDYAGARLNGTLQLASAERIAAATATPVVADFRQADVAVGGEGAPITAGAVERLIAVKGQSRLLVNIGGMANYFYFPATGAKADPKAADCGPGNSLSDLLAVRLFDKPFDRGGGFASRGQVSERLLSLLLGDPFFTGKRASTGRETFGARMARTIIDFGRENQLDSHDLMRTAAELTTRSIAMAVWPVVRRDTSLDKLYLTGGGRHNRFFVERLRYHLPDLKVVPVEELGYDGDYFEAVSFAVLGEAALRGEAMPVYSRRKRGKAGILGQIVQAPLSSK
jgi:anhydro-N-acetylmuramic acid kinase